MGVIFPGLGGLDLVVPGLLFGLRSDRLDVQLMGAGDQAE